jgi:hypothetical protein
MELLAEVPDLTNWFNHEEAGLVECWREVGWPEACRPEGDSFTCGLDQGIAVQLLRLNQHRHPAAAVDFPALLVNLPGSDDTDSTQQQMCVEKTVLGSRRKTQQQECYPHV